MSRDEMDGLLEMMRVAAATGGKVSVMAGSDEDRPRRRGMAQPSDLPRDIQVQRLKDNFTDLSRRHAFQPGDIAETKPGLGGQWRIPAPGQPVIVTRLLEPPIRDPQAQAGTIAFGRDFDIVVMAIDDDGDVVEFAFDSSYFQPIDDDGSSNL